MGDPDMTPLAEASYHQILDELKLRHYAGAVAVCENLKVDKTGSHIWGPITTRTGLVTLLHEQMKNDVQEWIDECETDGEEDADG